MARLLGCATLAFVGFIATSSAGRPPVTRLDALPRMNERLAEPIWVPHCGMKIVEWRSTSALRSETTPSDEALAVIDDACRQAFRRYGDFLQMKKLPRLHVQPDGLPAISLLPGNTMLDGKSLRALNDLPARFEAVAPGCCYWGLYVDSLNHLFLRNDPLIRSDVGTLVANPRFVRTLTHEIGHVLSARLGVWDSVGYDRQRDEELAEEFVAFVGMHFPAESSAEDLAFHRGRTAPIVAPAPQVTTIATSKATPAKPAQDLPLRPSANTSPQR
ncbi:MAG: hypothetical protein M3O46_17155 [Myxococcota bacterium]|nr:hypothetical protein [Myxococcota bacterium]